MPSNLKILKLYKCTTDVLFSTFCKSFEIIHVIECTFRDYAAHMELDNYKNLRELIIEKPYSLSSCINNVNNDLIKMIMPLENLVKLELSFIFVSLIEIGNIIKLSKLNNTLSFKLTVELQDFIELS